jgi:hypothetical protein
MDHTLKSRIQALPLKPLKGRISFREAAREYASVRGLCYCAARDHLLLAIDAGQLEAARCIAGKKENGKPRMMLSPKKLALFIKKTDPPTPPATDMESIGSLAKEFKLGHSTITKWQDRPNHPALGRALYRSVRANGDICASRSDISQCVDALRSQFFSFQDNPGTLLSEEIFQRLDGMLCFSPGYIDRHKAKYGNLSAKIILKPSRRDRLQPLSIKTKRPGPGSWSRLFFPEDRLVVEMGRRTGKEMRLVCSNGEKKVETVGEWLPEMENKLWRDHAGLWYSTRHVAELLGETQKRVSGWVFNTSGIFTNFKTVPKPQRYCKRQGLVYTTVIHESEIRPLLGLPPLAAPAGQPALILDTAAGPPSNDEARADKETPRKKKGSGREMDPANAPKYGLCHRLYAEVQAGKMKLAQAVSEVLREYGADALGEFEAAADPSRKFRDQRKRLKDNAKVYRNWLKSQQN